MRGAKGFVAGLAAAVIGASLGAQEILVSGRVVDERVRPVAQAVVELVATPDPFAESLAALNGEQVEAAAITVTDTDGRYRLEAPAPGLYRLHVRAEGCPEVVYQLEPILRSTGVLPVELRSGRLLSVLVGRADGGPVERALLRYASRPERTRDEELFRQQQLAPITPASLWRSTGANGRVQWTVVAGIDGELGVAVRGGSTRSVRVGDEREVELVLGPTTQRGVEVLDQMGRRLKGALISVGTAAIPVGQTDDTGRLEVGVPQDGAVLVRALVPGAGRASITLTSEAPPWTPIVVDSERIVGSVLSASDGQGIAHALVYTLSSGIQWTTTSDVGTFDLEVPPGRRPVELEVVAAGYRRRGNGRLRVERQSGREITITLKPGVAISGRVVDDRAAPVEGARLLLASATSDGADEAVTDFAGRFSFATALANTVHRLEVTALGYPEHVERLAAFESKSKAPFLEVVLPRGSLIQGRLVDAGGAPVGGVEVSATPFVEGEQRAFRAPAEEARTDTDAGGDFRLGPLAAGRHNVAFRARGFADKAIPAVDIGDNGELVDLGKIALEVGALLEARVVDESGVPLVGASISFEGFREEGESPDAVTDAEGTFKALDFRAGEMPRLYVEAEGYSPLLAVVEVPTVEPFEIALERGYVVEGQAIDAAGEPVAFGSYSVDRIEPRQTTDGLYQEDQRRGRLDADGRLRARGLGAGHYRLRIERAGEGETFDLEVPQSEPLVVKLETLEPQRWLHGRVVGPDGLPVEGVAVESRRRGSLTDFEGRFAFAVGSADTVELRVNAPGAVPYERVVDLVGPEPEVEIRLEAGLEIRGLILDELREPVAEAAVGWGGELRAVSDAAGRFVIDGLASGSYLLRARKEGYAMSAEERVVVTETSVDGVELLLLPGVTVLGEVRGRPELWPRIQVRASWQTGRAFVLWLSPTENTSVDQEGRFRLEHLAAGTWSVSLGTGPGGELHRSRSLFVKGDEGLVELVFDLEEN